MKERIPVRTLVIDDEQAVCRQLQRWLADEAFDVVTFTSAAEALRYARNDHCPLVLADLRMPDCDGAELVRKLCAARADVRVIGVIAFPEIAHVMAAIRAGVRDVLEKPLQRATVLAALERQLVDLGFVAHTEEAFNRRLGARLRGLRAAAGLTLKQVAEQTGITDVQVSQIELGKTATSTWTLARLCGALRISPARFFEGV